MAAVLLDTTVLIDLLRGRTGAIARLRALRDAGDLPYVCAINVEEIERGLKGDAESEGASRLFEGMLIASLDRAEGVRAGAWRREFGKQGRTLSQADCLVAAAAHRVGGRLATGNPKDFPMSEIVVDHWPVGD
jgi:predicted nucleic acid-binding protein